MSGVPMTFGDRWAPRFLTLADQVASWSKDPSTRVGAVLVDDRRRVVGVGYNGFPDRVPDAPDALADRERKLALMIHAEVNAVLNCPLSTRGLHLFVTHPPCRDCAKFVVQAGIASIHTWEPTQEWLARWPISDELFRAADLPLTLVRRALQPDAPE